MGDREAQSNDTDRSRGEAQEPPGTEWEETPVHPVLTGSDLTAVDLASSTLLYDPEDPRAWIRGETVEVGVGRTDEAVAEADRGM